MMEAKSPWPMESFEGFGGAPPEAHDLPPAFHAAPAPDAWSADDTAPVRHATLDVRDFAFEAGVPEHEHEWVTKVAVIHSPFSEDGLAVITSRRSLRDARIPPTDVFCAYRVVGCTARPE